MILGKVVGRSWGTIKHPCYEGRTVFAIQPILPDGTESGPSFLAVDSVGACPGQVVIVAREGNAARQVLGHDDDPLHSVVMGIVDDVHLSETLA